MSVPHKPAKMLQDMRIPKNWPSFFFFCFFVFLHTYKTAKNVKQYPIALNYATQKGGIKAHLGIKFGWNTISSQEVISDYSHKITLIYCHAFRVNHLWEEAENWYVDR